MLLIIAFTQAGIVAVWLLAAEGTPIATLGKWSLYVQWLVILNCAVMCVLREPIANLGRALGVSMVMLLSLFLLVLMELVARGWSTGFSELQIDGPRLARLALANSLIIAMALRFFAYLGTMENRNKAESQSRIAALQNRIQPHFLFNSLNTIAELTATDPEQAEQAINSLSMLFRASLENDRKTHTLAAELKLCERYVGLERWRVADRLNLRWRVMVENPKAWSMPKLILQPLIENAIVHGVQANGKIDIWVDVRETKRHLSIKVQNIVGEASRNQSGHGIALNNIKERLFVMYDDQQTFKVKLDAQHYSVIMQFPKTPYSK